MVIFFLKYEKMLKPKTVIYRNFDKINQYYLVFNNSINITIEINAFNNKLRNIQWRRNIRAWGLKPPK